MEKAIGGWRSKWLAGAAAFVATCAVALTCSGYAMADGTITGDVSVSSYGYATSWEDFDASYISISLSKDGKAIDDDAIYNASNFTVKSSDKSVATATVVNGAPRYTNDKAAYLIVKPVKEGTATITITYKYKDFTAPEMTQEVDVVMGKWVKDGKADKYQTGTESYAKQCVMTINGKKYAFDKNGKMMTGWVNATDLYASESDSSDYKYEPEYYYFDKKSGAAVLGWQKISKKWYYFFADGRMAASEIMVDCNGNTYGFKSNGVMATGWFDNSLQWNGNVGKYVNYRGKGDSKTYDKPTWYYLASNGVAKYGWTKISGKWYYLGQKGSASLDTGYVLDNTGTAYVTDVKTGAMKTGWYNTNSQVWDTKTGKWGAYTTSKKSNGTTVKNYPRPSWYYASKSGVLVSGWNRIGGKWYYFGNPAYSGSPMTQAAAFTDYTGTWYVVNKDGVMQTNKWVNSNLSWDTTTGKWTNKEMDWDYDTYGSYSKPSTKTADARWYYAGKSGELAYGWNKLSGKWYYLGSYNGRQLATGWFQPDDGADWYYANDSGVMQSNKWIGAFHLNKKGVWDKTK